MHTFLICAIYASLVQNGNAYEVSDTPAYEVSAGFAYEASVTPADEV